MFKCFLGLHHYEIVREENIYQVGTDLVIGKVIISRCTICGKIKQVAVKTVNNIYIG